MKGFAEDRKPHPSSLRPHPSFRARLASLLPALDFPQLWKSCGFSTTYGPVPLMNVWKQVLSSVEQLIDRTEYESWFAPTRFVAQKGDTIDVSVPSQRYV